MYNKLHQFWTASISRQLMLGIALVHAVLMSIFVFDIVSRERTFLTEQSKQHASALVKTLAANGTSWVLARDFIGMEEVIKSQSVYPNLRYAMFIDLNARVLGYTEREKVGLYVNDSISQKLFKSHALNGGEQQTIILVDNPSLIDLAYPIVVDKKHIGWARVSISLSEISHNLKIVTRKGLLYTLLAILTGLIFAYFMARGLTSDINRLTQFTDTVIKGKRKVNLSLNRHDELGKMAENIEMMVIALQKKELQAQSSYREKSNFLSTISHEIKTPLNSIVGVSQLLRSEFKNPTMEQKESLDILQVSSNNLLNLVMNILNFSKLDSRSVQVNQSIFDLYDLIQQIIKQLTLQLKQKKIQLVIDIDKKVPDLLTGDMLKLSQILSNLLNNAIKFMPLHSAKQPLIKLSISSVKTTASDTILLFIVKDNGIGIAEQKIPTIFNLFTQLDDSSTRLHNGVGLGLNIVKSLVDLLNGHIRVESSINKGTSFFVQLAFKSVDNAKQISHNEAINPFSEQELLEKGFSTQDEQLNKKLTVNKLKKLEQAIPQLWTSVQQSNIDMFDHFKLIKKIITPVYPADTIDKLEFDLENLNTEEIKQSLIELSKHFEISFL